MEHKFVNFDAVERVLGVGDGLPEFLRDSDEDTEYRRMVRVLRRAMEGELTARQKRCLELYYFEGKTMEETGRELGIWKSTVSRHLKKARSRVGEILRYSSDRLAP